ncbi:hypothetical protein COB21_01880 [Candidatus Aerophobetes bacterium]|uniref:EamA domain-containing protein n=1 Tax=Aerophobetes bacterium TaxID=2030807 RepID=A0A2A4X636_UNCAE|nr:MAG: hypothetical protein COB21_01880 [Candidatus Aerophobetes bacterium]
MRKNKPSLAILFSLLAGFFYACLALNIKLSLQHQGVPLIVFFRQLFSLCFLFLLFPLERTESRSLKSRVVPLHLLRAFASTSGMFCFYIALKHISLSDAVMLSYTRPLFIPFVVYLWSGKIGKKNLWIGLLIGFLGVILILNPDGDVFSFGSIVGLCSGILGALAFTTIRKLTKTEPANRIIFYYLIISLFLTAIPLLMTWETPSSEDWISLVIIAAIAIAYQSCLTRAYQYASAPIVGSLLYSAVVFSFFFEYILGHGTSINLAEIIGAILIAAGSFISLRSQKEVK